MNRSLTRKLALLSVLLLVIPACSFFASAPAADEPQPPSHESPTDQVEPPEEEPPSNLETSAVDPRIEALLTLTSVRMALTTTYPGMPPREVTVQVDAAGNQQLQMRYPPVGEADPNLPADWDLTEIYRMDGAAFLRVGTGEPPQPAPDQATALADLLYSPDAPGLWLLMLSSTDASQGNTESSSGFTAKQYLLDTVIETYPIQGEFWVDEESGALVAADLTIDGAMFAFEEAPAEGDLIINFRVEKADIPPITLPE